MVIRTVLLLGLFAWAHNAQVEAATYYVATTGSDTNPGTEAEPFASLQKAVDSVKPGDIVNVRDGSYAGFAKDNLQGAPDAWITIRSHPGEKAVIDQYLGACDCSARDGVIYLGGVTAYVIFEGFEITNTDPVIDRVFRKLDLRNPVDVDTWRKYLADPAYARTLRCSQAFRLNGPRATPPHHLIFRNLVIHHILDIGFSGSGNDMQFLNNRVHDLGYPRSGYGWYLVGERITWRGNVVHNTVFGFHLRSGSRALKDSLIENNVIYNNGGGYWWHMSSARVREGGGGGIYISADGGGNVIRNNIVHGNVDGVRVFPNRMEILDNMIYRNTRHGVRVHGGSVKILNNLIQANGTDFEVTRLEEHPSNP